MTRLLLLLLLLGCEENIAMVSSACNLPCYAGPKGTAGNAHCTVGITVCDDEGIVVDCDGESLPEEEVCDTVDNDCDGMVDNGLTDEWVGLPCGNAMGVCKPGRETCVGGASACIGEEFGSPELCNGLDDDCNGLVDDDLNLEFCYTADASTLAHGECRAGINECVGGHYVCMYQRVPTTETCNGLDDDCDGFIDEDLTSGYDIMFMMDTSGSMRGFIADSVSAAHRTATRLEDTDTRYGAAVVPGERGDVTSGYAWTPVAIVTDLTDSAVFQSAVVGITTGSGGFEPTIDAIYELCVGNGTTWRPDATNALVLFSDENPQTGEGRAAQEATDACVASGVVLYVFTTPEAFAPYDDMTLQTGGNTFFLSSSIWMFEDLTTLFSEDCE
jgi:hypothetical protein